MRIYLIEITAAVDAAGTTTILRFASSGYTTEPGDMPANAQYLERLKQPALVRRDMFANGTTGGASRIGFGEVILINIDGGLDYLRNYGFDGRPLVVKVGDPDAGFSSFKTVLTATMDLIELDSRSVRIRVRDRQFELADVLQTNRYQGTGGLEGGDDVQGKVKPLVFGAVLNVSPVLVDAALLIYQVADNVVAVSQVYEGGLAMTAGAPYASTSDLLTVAPAAGEYRTFQGFIRLGSSPVFGITCDVSEGATVADRTAAQVLKRLALQVGISAVDIDAGDVVALDALNSAEVGVYVEGESNALSVMDQVAQSIGAFYGFDQLGKLRMGRFSAPVGSPVGMIDQEVVVGDSLQRRLTNDNDRGLPTYRARLLYRRNWTVQDRTQLAGAVTDAKALELSQANRTVLAEDITVLDKHPLSPELERDTVLVDKTAAQTEANRLLNLYKVPREIYEVVVHLRDELIDVLEIGKELNLAYPRFGLDAGKNFVILGVEPDYQLNRARLILWG